MAYFRKPKTQNERKADQAVLAEQGAPVHKIKARKRTLKKAEAGPPTDHSDLKPAARNDRSRGKPSHSPARKAKQKVRDKTPRT
ncbi:hypothetical protein WNY37_04165 [Henriciella sp. AS95]|uniref:hypothetical protein n=1 Tax=Henriciella sp. AS95 TaxID=3135782 RepID=UPI00317AED6B